MSRAERFQLRHAIVKALGEPRWEWDAINLLFAEFDLPMVEDGWDGRSVTDVIAAVADESSLIELYAVAAGVSNEEVLANASSPLDEAAGWKPEYVRLFISHSAVHKAFVSEVSDHLAVLGIDGFVAHHTMEVERPWQAQIEQALRTMEAFVLLIHEEVSGSAWCHQEVGWALGRRVPFFALRLGADPVGFPSHVQWPSLQGGSPRGVADQIAEWVVRQSGLGDVVIDRLLQALGRARNYYDAEAVAARIASLGNLSDAQFERLDGVWWSNDQVYGGALPTKKMRPFYISRGRPWPPAKPAEEQSKNAMDEEPF
ncbi:MAG TPA: toll/interleukin-1 receptor domain-containing protein [Acidimicrobiales bacterium]|nr:toll/interleukin-1 receptor domain-containing protein [Acidimicrobiales bacterium]